MFTDKIFREYDIRGIVDKDFDDDFAFSLGRAFVSLLTMVNAGAKRVSVGRDARLSSERLAANLVRGIVSAGIDVYDIGLCPTPLQYFSLHHLVLDGGIMVTGSHNPPEYNGFKLSVGKETIFGATIQKLEEIIRKKEWSESPDKGHVQHRVGKSEGIFPALAVAWYKGYLLLLIRVFSLTGQTQTGRCHVTVRNIEREVYPCGAYIKINPLQYIVQLCPSHSVLHEKLLINWHLQAACSKIINRLIGNDVQKMHKARTTLHLVEQPAHDRLDIRAFPIDPLQHPPVVEDNLDWHPPPIKERKEPN